MTSQHAWRRAGAVVFAAVMVNVGSTADDARTGTQIVRAPASGSIAQRSTPVRSTSGKGPLPDPTLLDGSSQPAEKKSEQGMIGDFELPGDENVRDGKVGGQPGQPGGKGPQEQPGLQVNVPMPGLPLPLPGQSQSGGAQNAGGAGLNIPDPTQQGAGAGQQSAGGPNMPNPAAGANAGGQPQSGAAGGADGKPDGVQVGQLQGEGGAAGQDAKGGAGPGGKPSPIAIGDSAMRIEPSANAPAATGQQQAAGHTQQHDKGTGSGGRGPAGGPGGGRIEKGKTMPAGL